MSEIRSDNRLEQHPKPVQEYERRFTGSTWVDWADTAELEAVYNVAYRPNKYFWINGHYFECLSDGITYRQITGGGGGFTTADNGLTANTATNVQLGGTLIKDTTIDAANFGFALNNGSYISLYPNHTDIDGNFSEGSIYQEASTFGLVEMRARRENIADNTAIQAYMKLEALDGQNNSTIQFLKQGNPNGIQTYSIPDNLDGFNNDYILPISVSVNGGSPSYADSIGNIDISTISVSTIQWSVLDILNTPPAAVAGDIYLVGTAGTGAWSGHNNEIATYNGATWTFQTAAVGDILYDANDDFTYQNVTGNTWVNVGKLSIHQGGDSYAATIRIGSIDNSAMVFRTHNATRITISNAGAITLNSLTGVGNQVVGIDATGLLSRVSVQADGLSWLLASGGTLTNINTITSSRANGLIFNGTWTQANNNDYAFKINPTITGDATASDIVQALLIQPTITAGGATQSIFAATIDGTNLSATNTPTRYALRIIANSNSGFNGIAFANTLTGSIASITIDNTQNFTIAGQSRITLTNNITGGGDLQLACLLVAADGGTTSATAALLFAGSNPIGYTAVVKRPSSQILGIGVSGTVFEVASAPFQTAASGIHALVAGAVFKPLSFNVSGGATVTNTATVYIEGSQSGIVTPGASYSLWVDDGISRFDGALLVASPGNATQNVITTDATQTLTNKTITAPVISSITNTGTLTLPTVAGTIVQYASASIASSGTPTPTGDAAVNFLFITALTTGGAAFAVPSGTPTNGNTILIRILDDGTARTITWNGIYRASTDLPLPAQTTLSKTMYLKFIYNSASTTWDFVSFLNNF